MLKVEPKAVRYALIFQTNLLVQAFQKVGAGGGMESYKVPSIIYKWSHMVKRKSITYSVSNEGTNLEHGEYLKGIAEEN